MSNNNIGPGREKPQRKGRSTPFRVRRMAVRKVVLEGQTKASVAREFKIPESTLRGWCKNPEKYVDPQFKRQKTGEEANGAEPNQEAWLRYAVELQQRLFGLQIPRHVSQMVPDQADAFNNNISSMLAQEIQAAVNLKMTQQSAFCGFNGVLQDNAAPRPAPSPIEVRRGSSPLSHFVSFGPASDEPLDYSKSSSGCSSKTPSPITNSTPLNELPGTSRTAPTPRCQQILENYVSMQREGILIEALLGSLLDGRDASEDSPLMRELRIGRDFLKWIENSSEITIYDKMYCTNVVKKLVYNALGVHGPNRFFSPHTTFIRKSGQPHELACALCSLLIGLGYDAYIVFGYAVRDVTLRIMTRVDSPYLLDERKEHVRDEGEDNKKYTVRPPRDLESKFLLMMEQKEIDKLKEEEEKNAELEKQREEEEERPPPDELEGMRFHFWVLIKPEGRAIDNITFVEPSTGMAHPVDSPCYSGIESVWNHTNYWVNMQDCREGLSKIDFNLRDVEKWEHLLVGEPEQWRETKENINMDDEEVALSKIMEEKHLDMPISWSLKIYIPHDVLKQKYPEGMSTTWYKRTLVDEYAPYVQYDGLITKITRYKDFDCTMTTTVEDRYQNRQDKLVKVVYDYGTKYVTEYFGPGREDAVIEHSFHFGDPQEYKRIIIFNANARHDGLKQIEFERERMVENYVDRDDFFYYRDVTFARKGHPPPGFTEGHRKLIMKVIEKFNRNNKISANKDVATREFAIVDRQILLQYHFGEGKVTASTRNFTKPLIAESGEGLRFSPDITSGYEAEIGVKPPRQLDLYMLFQKMLQEEENSLARIREIENQVSEFLMLRDHEMAFPKLDISLFNIEQNEEYRLGMLEKEKLEQYHKEKEIEDRGVEYLTPYLNELGNPEKLTQAEASKIRDQCLSDFRHMLLCRAVYIQKQFEHWTQFLKDKQHWYSVNQDTVTEEDEIKYFRDVNDLTFLLQCYEIRLARHRELSFIRYEAVVRYVNAQIKLISSTE